MPQRWLRKGRADCCRAPLQSPGYGMVIVALSWIVTGNGLRLGSDGSALILRSGFVFVFVFVFVAPALARGLYPVRRQPERGGWSVLARGLTETRRTLGNAMVFALVQLLLFLVWARAACMVHVFFPGAGPALPARC